MSRSLTATDLARQNLDSPRNHDGGRQVHDVEKEGSQVSKSTPSFTSGLSKFVQPVQEETYTIYFRSLAYKGRGSPLWLPEPNSRLSIEYRRNGFVIGDVGIIKIRGYFDSLFNICHPHDHPLQAAINLKHLPTNYSPMQIEPSNISHYKSFNDGACVSSSSIFGTTDASSGLTFESSASEGAILTLPDGSNSEDLRNTKQLQQYLAVHAEDIYRCVMNVHGCEIRNGDLRVVTGFDKTTSWKMAAFLKSKPSFHLEVGPTDQGRAGQWTSSRRTEVQSGPSTRAVVALRKGDPSKQDVKYENQTVFLRTYTLSLKSSIWNALVSECGFGEMEDDPDTPLDSRFENNPSPGPSSSNDGTRVKGGQSSILSSSFDSPSNLAIHPSTAINAMLLKLNQGARMAVTGDDIWTSLLTDDDIILPSIETLWSRIMKSYDIRLENGTVFLVKPETAGKRISETAAGTEFNGELMKRRHPQEINQVNMDIRGPRRPEDEEVRQELEAETRNHQGAIQKFQNDSRNLASQNSVDRMEHRMQDPLETARGEIMYDQPISELELKESRRPGCCVVQ